MARARMALTVLAAVMAALAISAAVATPVNVDVDQIAEGDAVLNELAHEAQEADEALPTLPAENAYDEESSSHSEGGSAEDSLAALDAADDEAELDERAAEADMNTLTDLDADLDALDAEVEDQADADEDDQVDLDDAEDLDLDADEEEEEDSEEEEEGGATVPKPPTPAKKPAAPKKTTTTKPATPAKTTKPAAAHATNTKPNTIAPMAPMKKYTGTEKPFPIFDPFAKWVMATNPTQWNNNKCPFCRNVLTALQKAPKTCTTAGGLLKVCQTAASKSCTTTACPNVCGAVAKMDTKSCVDMVELADQAKNDIVKACDALRMCAQ